MRPQDCAQQIARGAALNDGFRLYLVECDSFEATVEFSFVLDTAVQHDAVWVGPPIGLGAALVGVVASLAEEFVPGRHPVVVVSLEAEDTHTFSLLNQQRERFVRAIPYTVVLLGCHGFLEAFRKAAIDTWSIRSGGFTVGEE